ncbi:hypothetical protein ACNKHS_23025 [Shigella flexneri]
MGELVANNAEATVIWPNPSECTRDQDTLKAMMRDEGLRTWGLSPI